MTATYDLISEQVLSSAASSVTFSNIPQGFKDLVLEVVARTTGSGTVHGTGIRLNSDTGLNYSLTRIEGDGSAASSSRDANASSWNVGLVSGSGQSSGTFASTILQLHSYSNSSVFKTALVRASDAASLVRTSVCMWRSTSAVTSISFSAGQGDLVAGTTARLWGVVG